MRWRPAVDLPLTLAHRHAALAVGSPIKLAVRAEGSRAPRFDGSAPPGAPRWNERRLGQVLHGAGFESVVTIRQDDQLLVRATRARTLPDIVGPDMRLLVCGLNPSLVSADAGFAYAGATNRFWRVALTAGLLSATRQPFAVLTQNRVGMTDLVKRATSRSHHLDPGEYRSGAERVRGLLEWLRPEVVLFVGLEGWRAAVDRRAAVGLQPDGFGGTAAYVMPSTSGANARSSFSVLVDHVRAAMDVAGARSGGNQADAAELRPTLREAGGGGGNQSPPPVFLLGELGGQQVHE